MNFFTNLVTALILIFLSACTTTSLAPYEKEDKTPEKIVEQLRDESHTVITELPENKAGNFPEKNTSVKLPLDGKWNIVEANCLNGECQSQFKTVAKSFVGKNIEIDGSYLEFPALRCFTTELTEFYTNKKKLISDDPRMQKLPILNGEISVYSLSCGRYTFELLWPKDTDTAFIVTRDTGVYLTLQKDLADSILNFESPAVRSDSSGKTWTANTPSGANNDILFLEKSSERTQSTKKVKEADNVVIVYYGTNRKPVSSNKKNIKYSNERGEVIKFGHCRVGIPPNHEKGNLESPSPFWEYVLSFLGKSAFSEDEHVTLLITQELSEADFFKKVNGLLKEILQSGNQNDVLIYVHGWNNTFDEAARRTAQIAHDLDNYSGRAFFFSWPSDFSFYDVSSYSKAKEQAKLARPYLQEFLQKVVKNTGAKKIHLIAHSLGTELLANTLKDIVIVEPGDNQLFNQVFLAAPDITLHEFKTMIEPKIRGRIEQLTVYASNDDKALSISREFSGEPRLGQFKEELLPIHGIDLIDASILGEDMFGHSYQGEHLVLKDIKAVLSGEISKVRKQIFKNPYSYWQIKLSP